MSVKQAGRTRTEPTKHGVEMASINPPVPVSLAQAARQFRIGPHTVRLSLIEGDMPGYRLGREWVIFRDELDWWIARQLGSRLEPLDPVFMRWTDAHIAGQISETALAAMLGKNRYILTMLDQEGTLRVHNGRYRIADLVAAMRWN